jgi:hypothetical protein
LTHTTKHSINGRTYEITVNQSDHKLEVKTFYDGHRIARYVITLENTEHVQAARWQPPLKELIDLAKADLEAGIVKVEP